MAYRIGRPSAGDEFVVVALEEATLEVDKAIKSTVDNLFSGSRSITNSTPAELLRLFRYPPESQRGLARSAEIYERTLQLVAEKVRIVIWREKALVFLKAGSRFYAGTSGARIDHRPGSEIFLVKSQLVVLNQRNRKIQILCRCVTRHYFPRMLPCPPRPSISLTKTFSLPLTCN